ARIDLEVTLEVLEGGHRPDGEIVTRVPFDTQQSEVPLTGQRTILEIGDIRQVAPEAEPSDQRVALWPGRIGDRGIVAAERPTPKKSHRRGMVLFHGER